MQPSSRAVDKRVSGRLARRLSLTLVGVVAIAVLQRNLVGLLSDLKVSASQVVASSGEALAAVERVGRMARESNEAMR